MLELFGMLQERLARHQPGVAIARPSFRPFREGDIRHSQASIAKAEHLLGYRPTHSVAQGLDEAADWYAARLR